MSVVSSIRTAASQAWNTAQPSRPSRGEFARILQTRLDERRIAVSLHAADRMARRGLPMDDVTVGQLHTAFDLASQKGAKEALFLLDDMAVIASVPDRTVKTALDRRTMNAGVFTHIDTTVVLSRPSDVPLDNNQTDNLSTGSFGRAPSREATIPSGGLPL